MNHAELKWNPETQEWYCPRCGRTLDHTLREDSRAEIEHFNCISKPAIPIVFLSAYMEFPGESIGIAESWIKKGEEDPESLLARFRELVSARPLPRPPLH